MNTYAIWCDLANSSEDLAFVHAVEAFLRPMIDAGHLHSYTLERRKFGFGPEGLGEFHIRIHAESLVELEHAFEMISPRTGETERLHVEVFRRVTNFKSGLYRSFPDPNRAH